MVGGCWLSDQQNSVPEQVTIPPRAPEKSAPLPSPQPSAEVVPQPASEQEAGPELEPELYGNCRVTAYCSCELCCGEYAKNRPVDENGNEIVYGAAGIPLTAGVSVASPLPLGTKLSIPDLGDTEYIVQDRTAGWVADKYDDMIVDIYFDSHEACYAWLSSHGQDYFDVYIVEENADED